MSKHDPKKQRYGMQAANARLLDDDELAFIEGRIVPKPIQRQEAEVVLQDEDLVVPDAAGNYIPKETPVQTSVVPKPVAQNENTIIVNNANKKVELRLETSVPKPDGTSKLIAFSVTVNKAAVDITEDGISILMKNDLEIKPPTLIPMTIIMDSGVQYSVVYAGGKHRFGNFTNISFARIGDE